MGWHVSYNFAQAMKRTGGWTENFWNSITSAASVFSQANTLADFLRAVHGNTSYLKGVRLTSTDEIPLVQEIVYNQTIPTTSNSARDSDYPTNSLQLQMKSGTNLYKANMWLKGIWDGVVSGGGNYVPTGDFTGFINTLFSLLADSANGWSLYSRDKNQKPQPIKDITQAGIVWAANHGYDDNDFVRLSRCKGMPYANELWRINFIDADHFSLQGFIAPVPVQTYKGKGIARGQARIFVPIGTVKILQATSHKVGKPIGLLSGRRKKRAS